MAPRARRSVLAACIAVALGGGDPVFADVFGNHQRFLSMTDYGGIGIFQTPSARMMADGGFAMGASIAEPHGKMFVTAQLLPGLETSIRYSDIADRAYAASTTGQSFKDRGIDAKFRLWEEDAHSPEVAIGIRDIGGTGLFSSEFLVGTKRYRDFDFSLGLAWGKLGSRGHMDNPLSYLLTSYETRTNDFGAGGKPAFSSFFSGEDVAFFGSVQWFTPIDGLRLAVEYDGNSYEDDPATADLVPETPFNFGLNYQVTDWLDLVVGLEGGERYLFGLSTKLNLHTLTGMPELEKGPPRINRKQRDYFAEQLKSSDSPELKGMALKAALKPNGMSLKGWSETDAGMTLFIDQGRFRYFARAMSAGMRAVDSVLPGNVGYVKFVFEEGGLDVNQIEVIRDHFVAMDALEISSDELYVSTSMGEYESGAGTGSPIHDVSEYPAFNFSINPRLRQHVGGPDNFYFWQLWLAVGGRMWLTDHLSLNAVLSVDVYNNFDELNFPSDSKLPHVRSDIKDYLKEGENGFFRLAADYAWTIQPGVFASLSAGYLEEMYGGFGGEVLYWPYESRFAIGAELARVRKRAFDKGFEFLDYQMTTGHINFYYNFPWYGLKGKASIGRYLAGDIGTTIDLSREFDSGFRVGAFFSLTDIPFEEFGEGSFDKGFYISFPMELLRVTPSKGQAAFTWRPLTRDGGQKVGIGPKLYNLVEGSRKREMEDGWDRVFEW